METLIRVGSFHEDRKSDQAIKHQSCLEDPDHHMTEVVRVKGKPSKEEVKGVIYKVPCECGAVYIGETGHNLRTRLQGHKRVVINGDTEIGIATHVRENDHKIQ